MRDLVEQDILPLVVDYLSNQGYVKLSEKLIKTSQVDMNVASKLRKKGLETLFTFFIESHPKILKSYQLEPKKQASPALSRKSSTDCKKSADSRKVSVDQKKRKTSEQSQEPKKRKNS